MKWRKGELFVAGLSNQDLASILRRVRYPFDAKQSITSVEIFHGGHNLVETRAPIRAMSFADLGGKPYLVAAYTCTPLVLIPLDALKDGAHVRGKTIAELGYGNTPADMIPYSTTVHGKQENFLMLVNFNRVSNVIPMAELEAARSRSGIEKRVPFGEITGVHVMEAPLAGALRIDNLDDRSFAEELGPILRTGEDVALTFDKRPVKRWHVGPVDAHGPAPSAWRLSTVSAASRQPLHVRLDAPIDGRDADYLAVVDSHDRLVDGRAKLVNGETAWTFVPAGPWLPGAYRLAVHGTLEDAAGNRVNGRFEAPMGTVPKQVVDVFVVFHVGPLVSPGPTAPSRAAR
jgi:hypothetical protein